MLDLHGKGQHMVFMFSQQIRRQAFRFAPEHQVVPRLIINGRILDPALGAEKPGLGTCQKTRTRRRGWHRALPNTGIFWPGRAGCHPVRIFSHRPPSHRPLKLIPVGMSRHRHRLPVIQSGAFELAIGDMEAERPDQMQRRTCGGTEPGDVAGILGDLGLHQHDVQRRFRPGERYGTTVRSMAHIRTNSLTE